VSPLTVHFHTDSGPESGLGHVARCEALAEAMVASGWIPKVPEALKIPAWATIAFPVLGSAPIEPVCQGPTGKHVHVYDSYSSKARIRVSELRCAGVSVWIQDDSDTDIQADIILNPNVGARLRPASGGKVFLAGAPYTLIREKVRQALGRSRTKTDVTVRTQRLVVSLGGMQNSRLTQYVATNLAPLGIPTVLTAQDQTRVINCLRSSLDSLDWLTIVPPTPHLPNFVRPSDTVLLSAGTTIWDMFFLGIPVAVTTTSSVQRSVVETLSNEGQILDLGPAEEWHHSASERLAQLVEDHATRKQVIARTQFLLDGQGSERVTGAIGNLLNGRLP